MKSLRTVLIENTDNPSIPQQMLLVYDIFVKILQSPTMEKVQEINRENELSINPHTILQQDDVLKVIAQYIEKFPREFKEQFAELFSILISFDPANESQTLSWLTCLAQLIHLAVESELNVPEIHQQLFFVFMNTMVPYDGEGVKKTVLTNIQQCANAGEALYYYIKYYGKYCKD